MKFAPLLIVSVSLILSRPSAARAQTNASATMPPAAQEAMEQGLIAAKQQEYLLAIQLFQDARKTAPRAPVLLFNLGLAESKISGRELRAMTWFGAYLEASPDAANGAAVREQIRVLDVTNQGSLLRLIRTAEDAAQQFGDTTYARSSLLVRVAVLRAKMGNIETAIQAVEHIRNRDHKDELLRTIATAQAEAGDIAGAQRTAESIQESILKTFVLGAIAAAQTRAGDIVGAQRTAGSIQAGSGKDYALVTIARAQAKAGDIASAQRTADSIQDASWKTSALVAIVNAQAIAGDIAGAQMTTNSIRDDRWKDRELATIAKAQAKAGDIAGSQRTIDSIQEASVKTYALISAGDIAGAQRNVGSIQDADWKNLALRDIAIAQAKAGDMAGAQRTARSIQDTDAKDEALEAIATPQATNPGTVVPRRRAAVSEWIEKNDKLLNAPVFLDLGAYLKSLPSDDAWTSANGLGDAVAKIATAREVLTQMLKRQADSRAKP